MIPFLAVPSFFSASQKVHQHTYGTGDYSQYEEVVGKPLVERRACHHTALPPRRKRVEKVQPLVFSLPRFSPVWVIHPLLPAAAL